MLRIAITLLFFSCSCVYGQSQCEREVTCQDCISLSPRCVWCSDESVNISVRCFDKDMPTYNCDNIQDPQSVMSGEETSTFSDENLVSPDVVNITLRPGVPVSFNVTVQTALNFPLDLYMLIDVSASLSDDIRTLRGLSSTITESLGNISSNYKIGFGTFVDKPVAPFSPLLPQSTGVLPYSYHHILTLTDDDDRFSELLDRFGNISYGADNAEGGFDSLLQAVACTKIIDWTERATRVILYISDAVSHIAGDGRLAGIVRPNDGQCHMTKLAENLYEYDKWNVTDYVSLAQLEEKLREQDISIIFAVEDKVKPFYEEMTKFSNRMFVQLLEESSVNIISIIRRQYEELLRSVLLEADPTPNINVEIEPIVGCDNVGTQGECTGVQVEQTVVFNVTVTADACVPRGTKFGMVVRGFDTITVNVEPQCNCACEEFAIRNSPECKNGTGTKVCGTCVCGQESGGPFQCPVSQNSQECSGSGLCTTCGDCECFRQNANMYYFGSTCECSTFDTRCADSQERICGGNGLCCNGECICTRRNGQPLFTGSLCHCTTDNNNCLNRRNEVCSGNGECECGQCRCTGEYTGELCDECFGESCQPCNIYSHCVRCHLGSTSIDCSNCTRVTIVTTDDSSFNNATECMISSGLCMYDYKIRQDEVTGNYSIFLDTNGVCATPTSAPFSIDTWWLILLAVLIPIIIIIIGIILLVIIKICLIMKDKRELKKFETEVQDAAWADVANPLYVTPVSEYPNLAYKPKKKNA